MKNSLHHSLHEILIHFEGNDFQLLTKTQEAIDHWKVHAQLFHQSPEHISSLWEKILIDAQSQEKAYAIEIPYPQFIQHFGDFQKGEIIVFGARPSMGKTTVLLQLALHISKNHRTLFFSPDLHERALVNRIISLEAHLPIQSLEKSKLDDPSFLKVLEATRFIHEQSLFINADYFHDIPEYLFFIENIILTKKMEVVFFDNVTSFGKRLGRHHHRWVSMFMRGLRKLAKELNITFILSNDVSRQCEKISMHKRPLLQHLSEQGDLHENADKVIFIYRPLYYGIIKDEIGNDIRHRMEWIVAKNKLGPEGTAVFHFDNALLHIRETSPNEAFYNGSSEKE